MNVVKVTNKTALTFYEFSDDEEGERATVGIAEEIQKDFKFSGKCLNRKTALIDLEQISSNEVLKFNSKLKWEIGIKMLSCVQFSLTGELVVVLVYCMDNLGACLEQLRIDGDIR